MKLDRPFPTEHGLNVPGKEEILGGDCMYKLRRARNRLSLSETLRSAFVVSPIVPGT